MQGWVARVAALLLLLLAGCAGPSSADRPPDLLVFAPHPDDEVLGCAGLIRRTLAGGARVRVVFFTHGDGFPRFASQISGKPAERLGPDDFLELARFRQEQSRQAILALGGSFDDLVFLGFPDSALEAVSRSDTPVRQKFTERTETYGPTTRRPSPYTRAALLKEVVEQIRDFRPGRICVSGEADQHPDHRSAFLITREAAALAAHPRPLETYLIHGGPEWPWPLGDTPGSPLERHVVDGREIPIGVSWPPPIRVALSSDEIARKREAILAHASHLRGATEPDFLKKREYLLSFVKSEEVFWPAEVRR